MLIIRKPSIWQREEHVLNLIERSFSTQKFGKLGSESVIPNYTSCLSIFKKFISRSISISYTYFIFCIFVSGLRRIQIKGNTGKWYDIPFGIMNSFQVTAMPW